jgi:hypothetical protein
MPKSAIINNKSAIFSRATSFLILSDFMEAKESIQEIVKKRAIIETNSSA